MRTAAEWIEDPEIVNEKTATKWLKEHWTTLEEFREEYQGDIWSDDVFFFLGY